MQTLVVIGMGAIGGSLAWRARLAGVRRVVGYAAEPADTVRALKAGAITEVADSPAKAVRDADLVILATPPHDTLTLLQRLAPRLPAGALVSDVCSVKTPINHAAEQVGLGDRFAGAHPLTGPPEPGFSAATPDRFRNVIVYVCPTAAPRGYDTARQVMAFWEQVLEAQPVLIDAATHDRQQAWISHLPHAAASVLAATIRGANLAGVSVGPAARQATRLAGDNPALWAEILMLNRMAVAEALVQAGAELDHLRALLASGDVGPLQAYLEGAAEFPRRFDR